MVVDPLTFAASLSSLTGVTLPDVAAAATKCKRLAEITHRSLEVRNLLATLEEPDDLLVGYWQLASWEISSDTMSVPNRFVSGGLAVHFRERNTRSWRGTMCLSYKTRHGWWMKKEFTGEPAFVALYDARFRAEERYFSGSSHCVKRTTFLGPTSLGRGSHRNPPTCMPEYSPNALLVAMMEYGNFLENLRITRQARSESLVILFFILL